MARFVALAALLLGACVAQTNLDIHGPVVRQRAAFDLGCSEPEIVVIAVGGTSYAARGCQGERVYTCTHGQATCVGEGNALPPAAPDPHRRRHGESPLDRIPTGAAPRVRP